MNARSALFPNFIRLLDAPTTATVFVMLLLEDLAWIENATRIERVLHPFEQLDLRRVELEAEVGCFRETDSVRSEEHTSELQSQSNLVCRLLLEKKKK